VDGGWVVTSSGPDRFFINCVMCGEKRSCIVRRRHGQDEIFAANDCKCPRTKNHHCDACGGVDCHWLGCRLITCPCKVEGCRFLHEVDEPSPAEVDRESMVSAVKGEGR
jgi:hypothetical protein